MNKIKIKINFKMPLTPTTNKPISFLFFFLPSSLLAFSLLLFFLACNGLLSPPPFLPPHPHPLPLPSINSPLALKQEQPTSTPSISLTPHHLQSNRPLPKPDTKLVIRRRRRRLLLKSLHPTAQSHRFSSRAAALFSSSSCTPRFFMTWISSLDSFGKRELFAMETLFKTHPNACLLIASNAMDSSQGRILLRPFSSRGFRVAALSPDYAYLLKNTPAELWFSRLRKGEVNPGEVPIGQNLSNLLRLALLYKYGGVYVDTDVIVMKSFLGLKNAIGAQAVDAQTGNWSRLNNAVLVFDKMHPLLYEFIEEFSSTFDGSRWGHNGPYLVSRVVERVAERPGFEFTVLPRPAFYPVNWNQVDWLFLGVGGGVVDSKWMEERLRGIREESFAVHLWNRQSRRLKVEEGSVIGRILSDCCLFCNSSLVDL